MGGRQTMPAEPVDQSRARFDAIFQGIAPMLPPPSDAVQTSDVTVPSSKQRVRIYKPAKATDVLPVGLYVHSGGWYAGSIEHEDFMCRNVAENSQIVLYSSEYRLAPENPYPLGLEDVCAAYEFMHETVSDYGGDPAKKFVMGGSAGGHLTAAVGLKYATHPELKAQGLCIFVPSTCEPSVLPQAYKLRYTPELYTDAPVIGAELVAQARGKSVMLFCSLSSYRPRMAQCTSDRSFVLGASPSRYQESSSVLHCCVYQRLIAPGGVVPL